MPQQFLHGVEVIEITSGSQPIRTLASSEIGLVGTAPNSQSAVSATLLTGVVASNNALTFTAASTLAGVLGNNVSVRFVNPNANSQALAVSVAGNVVTVSLATGSTGTITSTGAQVVTALAASTAASALLTVANTSGSTGAGVVAAFASSALSGGINEAFPLNTPVLVSGSRAAAALAGSGGTIQDALNHIFDQAGAAVVVVKVAAGADDTATRANVIGTSSARTGLWALTSAESVVGVRPRLVIAPTFSSTLAVGSAMEAVATRLRGIAIIAGPNTTDSDAITYATNFGPRAYVVDPGVQWINSAGATVSGGGTSRVAGVIAKSDNDRGFWWSPSNNQILNIVGTSRPVDFTLGDVNASANLLNAANVATVINQNGFRLWGNRCADGTFLSVRRTADLIEDSIQRAHLWAVDRNITKTYLGDVSESVNGYLRTLKNQGAILGGKCWPDPDLNTPANIAQGVVYFNFDFTPPYPAEHIVFQAILTNSYIATLTA